MSCSLKLHFNFSTYKGIVLQKYFLLFYMLLKNSFVNQQINVLCFTNDNVKLFANNNQTSVNTFFGVEIVTSTKPKKYA